MGYKCRRIINPLIKIEQSGSYITKDNLSRIDLKGANAGDAHLVHSCQFETNLSDGISASANLKNAHLIGSYLYGTKRCRWDILGSRMGYRKLIIFAKSENLKNQNFKPGEFEKLRTYN